MKNWFNKLSNFSKILHNKFVLYLLVFVYIINLLTFVSDDNHTYAGYMILISFLTSFFNKNMIIILIISIVITNLIRLGMTEVHKEGFDTSNLDDLINHLSNDPELPKNNTPSTSEPNDSSTSESNAPSTSESDVTKDKPVDGKPVDDFDDKLEKLIQSIELNKMFENFNKINFKKQLDESKTKIELTLTQINNIVNEQQRDKVKSILDIQLKMVEHLSGISPLIGEFKTVLNSVSS